MKFGFLFIIIVIILIYCLIPKNFSINLKQFNNGEKFIDTNTSSGAGNGPQYAFIGIDADDSNKIVFYHPKNVGSNKYYRFSVPNNEKALQCIYKDGMTIILTDAKKIYYCNNGDFINNNYSWSPIKTTLNGNMLNIKMIAFDNILGNKLFILSENGNVYINDNIISGGMWQLINLPIEDRVFNYIDSDNGYFAGVGKYTNFTYLIDISIIKNTVPSWIVLDKSKLINKVKITKHGVLGKTGDNDLYLCTFPCDGKADETWRLINNTFSTSVDANTEIISLIKDNSLFTCNKTCEINTLNQLTFTNDVRLLSGSVIDYIFPGVTPKPSVVPFDETLVTKVNNELEGNLQAQTQTQSELEKIKNKIGGLSETESKLHNKMLESQINRDQTVDKLISTLGFQNTYNFGTPTTTTTPTPMITSNPIEHFFGGSTPSPTPTQGVPLATSQPTQSSNVSEFAYLGVRDSLKDLTKKINNKTKIKPVTPTPSTDGLIQKPKSVIVTLG